MPHQDPKSPNLPFSRREFMRRSLWFTAAAAAGTAYTACTSRPDTVPDDMFLSPGAFLTLAAAAEALAPSDEGFALGAADLGTAQTVDELLRTEDPAIQDQFHGALWVLEWLPVAWYGRRFTRLSLKRRRAVFARLNGSRVATLRQVAQGVFVFVTLAFYSSEAVWPSIGYDGPWVEA